MNQAFIQTRGRVQRWLVGAALCLLATLALATTVVVSACLGSDGPPGAGAGNSTDDALRSRLLLSGLALPSAPSAEPPASLAKPRSEQPSQPPPAVSSADFIWPVQGYIVQGMWAGHPSGIDIGAASGTPIYAVRDGRVVFAAGDPCCSYGYYVIIAHDDGWSSLYGHLSAFDVKTGDEVKQGELIGRVGMTGKADGPHVHFEMRSYGGLVNPLDYLYPYRSAPPPPPYVASEPDAPAPAPAAQPAAAEPEPTPIPPEPSSGMSASAAIGAAIGWLSANADAAYRIDAGSCTARQSGPNWIVGCRAMLQGCVDTTTCSRMLSACVLSQPLLITSTC